MSFERGATAQQLEAAATDATRASGDRLRAMPSEMSRLQALLALEEEAERRKADEKPKNIAERESLEQTKQKLAEGEQALEEQARALRVVGADGAWEEMPRRGTVRALQSDVRELKADVVAREAEARSKAARVGADTGSVERPTASREKVPLLDEIEEALKNSAAEVRAELEGTNLILTGSTESIAAMKRDIEEMRVLGQDVQEETEQLAEYLAEIDGARAKQARLQKELASLTETQPAAESSMSLDELGVALARADERKDSVAADKLQAEMLKRYEAMSADQETSPETVTHNENAEMLPAAGKEERQVFEDVAMQLEACRELIPKEQIKKIQGVVEELEGFFRGNVNAFYLGQISGELDRLKEGSQRIDAFLDEMNEALRNEPPQQAKMTDCIRSVGAEIDTLFHLMAKVEADWRGVQRGMINTATNLPLLFDAGEVDEIARLSNVVGAELQQVSEAVTAKRPDSGAIEEVLPSEDMSALESVFEQEQPRPSPLASKEQKEEMTKKRAEVRQIFEGQMRDIREADPSNGGLSLYETGFTRLLAELIHDPAVPRNQNIPREAQDLITGWSALSARSQELHKETYDQLARELERVGDAQQPEQLRQSLEGITSILQEHRRQVEALLTEEVQVHELVLQLSQRLFKVGAILAEDYPGVAQRVRGEALTLEQTYTSLHQRIIRVGEDAKRIEADASNAVAAI